MYFDESGGGTHAVLLFHGSPTPPEAMLPLAKRLAPGRRILVPHFPGYGRSTGLAVLRCGELEPALDRELRGRGVRSCDVVGFSSGAFRALSYACRSELAVKRVVTLGGYARFSAEEREGMRGLTSALRSGAALEGVLPARMLRPETIAASPALAASVEAWRSAVAPEKLAEELDDIIETDLLPLLPEVQAAVLARVGDRDVVAPPSHSRAIAAACTRGALQIVENAPHALLLEDREATFRAVEAFLS